MPMGKELPTPREVLLLVFGPGPQPRRPGQPAYCGLPISCAAAPEAVLRALCQAWPPLIWRADYGVCRVHHTWKLH